MELSDLIVLQLQCKFEKSTSTSKCSVGTTGLANAKEMQSSSAATWLWQAVHWPECASHASLCSSTKSWRDQLGLGARSQHTHLLPHTEWRSCLQQRALHYAFSSLALDITQDKTTRTSEFSILFLSTGCCCQSLVCFCSSRAAKASCMRREGKQCTLPSLPIRSPS